MDEIRLVLLNRFKNLYSLLLELLLLQLILLSFTELEMGNFSCKLVINFCRSTVYSSGRGRT